MPHGTRRGTRRQGDILFMMSCFLIVASPSATVMLFAS